MSFVKEYFDDGHSGAGWYVYSDQYPDEGCIFAGTEDAADRMAAEINAMDDGAGQEGATDEH